MNLDNMIISKSKVFDNECPDPSKTIISQCIHASPLSSCQQSCAALSISKSAADSMDCCPLSMMGLSISQDVCQELLIAWFTPPTQDCCWLVTTGVMT